MQSLYRLLQRGGGILEIAEWKEVAAVAKIPQQ